MPSFRAFKLSLLALGLATLTSLSTAQGTAAKNEGTLFFHHYWPQSALTVKTLVEPWCEALARESAQKLRCAQLPAMSGGGTPAQLVDRVKDGVDDLVLTVLGYTPGRFPRSEVFELPFMTRNAQAASRAFHEYVQRNAMQEFAGMKILALWVHDEGQIHTRGKAIKALEDFRGMKMRAPSRETTKLLTALGASPIGMPITGVTDALTKGTLDGTMVPWDAAASFRIHEATQFHTETPEGSPALYTIGLVFAMNEKRYNALPAELRDVIDRNSGIELSAKMGKMWDDSAAPARAKAQAAGNSFYTLSSTELSRWVEAAKPVQAEWMIDMHKRGIDGRKLFEEARTLLNKHEAAVLKTPLASPAKTSKSVPSVRKPAKKASAA